ncbi:lipoprotein [Peptoniphilus sp. MSJ-1]|uniref:Lipoprotein n=1 Tax=Peptoniphilus ovalis TaxID=2841503 RepID=A0ABS6FEJ6_9FIRM|nr:lipoprotein [Peptoniphilus ovalis]MBU5668590.1 lipoprotein [Peptoniphilus ovalis]
MKKLLLLISIIFILTGCSKGEEIVFKTGERYQFNEFSVKIIDNEEEVSSVEIFNSKDDEKKKDRIKNLLSDLDISDIGNSYDSIPDKNSLIIVFKNKNNEDTLYMYDSERDGNTGKFHYSFYGEIEGKEVCLLSDYDMITEIMKIIYEDSSIKK